jgi:hypothetical protein
MPPRGDGVQWVVPHRFRRVHEGAGIMNAGASAATDSVSIPVDFHEIASSLRSYEETH